MDVNRNWTVFAADAEIDAHGSARLVTAHNALRAENARLRAQLAEADAVAERLRQEAEIHAREARHAREQRDAVVRRIANVIALLPPKDVVLQDGRKFVYVGPGSVPTVEQLDRIREAACGRGALDRVFIGPEDPA